MEKNDLFLVSEIIYQINSCQSMSSLKEKLHYHLNLLIPFTYSSYIAVREDLRAHRVSHEVVFCTPQRFAPYERAWVANVDQSHTKWLSSATETNVIRDSDLMTGDRRFNAPMYQGILPDYDICDCLQMNTVYEGHRLGRLSLYRTRKEGSFSDQDVFHLRVLSKHINLAFARCSDVHLLESSTRSLLELASRCHLTKREEEVLDCIFQGIDNAAICEKLSISRNTLYKHNNSIFQKCGVKSRWELLKLR